MFIILFSSRTKVPFDDDDDDDDDEFYI